jgi:hypothetical protein
MERRAYKDPFNKLCDCHKVMSVALSSFVKCYEDGGFMWHDKSTGEDVLLKLKPYVHCFVGGIAGINEMIGHYTTTTLLTVSSKTANATSRKYFNLSPNALLSSGQTCRLVILLNRSLKCMLLSKL